MWESPSGLALGRTGAVQRPFLIAQTARAVRMTSAAMGCTAGARQTAMTAISQITRPPRGPSFRLSMMLSLYEAAPRATRQRRPAVAGRSNRLCYEASSTYAIVLVMMEVPVETC